MPREGKAATLAGILVLSGLWGCRLGGASEPPVPPVEPSALGPSVLDGRVGEALELVVPLLGGGTRSLVELRGTPVLLELSDATVPDREAAQARYRALAERHGEGLTVVCVALDPQADALPASWTDDRPPFVLGWDPQGAVAARLQIVALPTVVLLDAAGTIVAVHEGTPPDDAALERWLAGPEPRA